MKGFPKTLKTKEDYYNCLAMVAAGELDAADLERKIDSLEKQRFIQCAIVEVVPEKKAVNEALVVELERIRDEDDRQNKRIAVIEEDTKAIHKLTASIEKLVIQMQDMLSEQKEQGERIRRLEEEPGNAWNEVKKKAIDTVVGLVAGALATGLIYMIAQNM